MATGMSAVTNAPLSETFELFTAEGSKSLGERSLNVEPSGTRDPRAWSALGGTTGQHNDRGTTMPRHQISW